MFGRYRYRTHRWTAHHRGIPFELTYKQWLSVWKNSGHFNDRGYVMARFGDEGGYSLDNVKIITRGENVSEAQVKICGEDRHNSKFTWALVRTIRRRYKPRNRVDGLRAMAREFNVSASTMWQLLNNETWR